MWKIHSNENDRLPRTFFDSSWSKREKKEYLFDYSKVKLIEGTNISHILCNENDHLPGNFHRAHDLEGEKQFLSFVKSEIYRMTKSTILLDDNDHLQNTFTNTSWSRKEKTWLFCSAKWHLPSGYVEVYSRWWSSARQVFLFITTYVREENEFSIDSRESN